MRANLRVLGNFCLVLVIIGFCMPMACDSNGFEIAQSRYSTAELSFALYGLFITAIIGFIIGVLLLAKMKIPIYVDWLVLLACLGCGLIPFFYNINDYGDYYQSGTYMILAGIILSFIFLFMASTQNDTGSSTDNNSSGISKKCPFCANEIKQEAVVCQFCNRDLPPEFSIQNALANKIPVKEKEYSVITPTDIFYERNTNSNVVKNLNVGDKIYLQYDVKEGQIVWYFVKVFNVEGWCKADYLKQC